jgi:hypothetical protein
MLFLHGVRDIVIRDRQSRRDDGKGGPRTIVILGAPKGQTFDKRQWTQLKFNNAIRDRGLKQELCLGSKKTLYEALGQALMLEIVKRTVFCQNSKNECHDIMEELASTQMEEETTSSLRTRDVGALATLRSFARTIKKDDGGTPGPGRTLSGNCSGQAPLRREQLERITMKTKLQGRKVRPITHVTNTVFTKEKMVIRL